MGIGWANTYHSYTEAAVLCKEKDDFPHIFCLLFFFFFPPSHSFPVFLFQCARFDKPPSTKKKMDYLALSKDINEIFQNIVTISKLWIPWSKICILLLVFIVWGPYFHNHNTLAQ